MPQSAGHHTLFHDLDGILARVASCSGSEPAGLPDLESLFVRLDECSAAPGARAPGGVLKDGTAWTPRDVVDVPSVDLPLVPPPNPEHDRAVAATTGQATALAAAMWLAEVRASQGHTPQPDLVALQQRAKPNPRVIPAWRTGAWIAAKRPAVPATTEVLDGPGGPLIHSLPTQHLIALWSPSRRDEPHLGRWPRRAFLVSVGEHELDDAALAAMPDETALWWLPATSDLVDWALVAEIVLLREDSLHGFQAEALRSLVAEERRTALGLTSRGRHLLPGGEPVERRA